jgi:dienelactone hydrolase
MADLYMHPEAYGTEQVMLQAGEACEIVYPTDADDWEGPIRPGTYPLMVFVHGDRIGEESLCPPDVSMDYWRWGLTLRYLARSGIIVAIPDVSGISSSESVADLVETTIDWMHFQWAERANLWHKTSVIAPALYRAAESKSGDQEASIDPRRFAMRSFGEVFGADVTAPGGLATRVGLAGHSWGARAAALVANRTNRRVAALATVAGTFDEPDSLNALVQAAVPKFMIAGTDDPADASYLDGVWGQLSHAKHQAKLLGVGHWDWVPAIARCDGTPLSETGSHAYLVMSELLLTFMTKYIGRSWYLPSDLVGPPGERAQIMPLFDDGGAALAVRWDDPLTEGPSVGEVVYGEWDDSVQVWAPL